MDLISVIVPIYKVEPYLHRCVDSILAQTYQDLEVVLVDDGSPDGCPKICDEYAARDKRIKVIHKDNGGLSSARNAGLDVASGGWISFIDSDDWIEPDMYEILLRNATSANAEISVGGVNDEVVDNDCITVTKTTYHGALKEEILSPTEAMVRYFTTSWAAWDKIYRKELFQRIRFPVGEINEDEAIVLKLLDSSKAIVYTNQVFYHYIHRAQSITTSGFSENKLAWYRHCQDNLRWIQQCHPDLVTFAEKRLCSSIIWTLRGIALSPQDFDEIAYSLQQDIRSKYLDFCKCALSQSERGRLWLLRFMPFRVYKRIEQMMNKRSNRRAQNDKCLRQ